MSIKIPREVVSIQKCLFVFKSAKIEEVAK